MKRISDEKLKRFDEQGYLLRKDCIPAELMKQLYEAMNDGIDEIINPVSIVELDSEKNKPRMYAGFDLRRLDAMRVRLIEHPDVRIVDCHGYLLVDRIDRLHRYLLPVSLMLTGSYEMRAIAERFCGPNFVEMRESLLLSSWIEPEGVPWHRDVSYNRTSRIVVVNVYISETLGEHGGLKLIPGSHLMDGSIDEIVTQHGDKAISIDASLGDVLIYDPMIVHATSELDVELRSKLVTIEYRAEDQVLSNPRYSPEWLDARRRLQSLARSIVQKPLDILNPPPEINRQEIHDFLDEMYSIPVDHDSEIGLLHAESAMVEKE